MGLRDITADLKERLEMLEAQGKAENVEYERARKSLEDRHNAKLAELEDEWNSIHRLLSAEMRRLGKTGDSRSAATAAVPALSLDDFFVNTVEKFGMASKENLRNEAFVAGYFADGESSGRRIHATIMNIVRAGRIRQVSPDTYAPAHKPGEFLLNQGALHS